MKVVDIKLENTGCFIQTALSLAQQETHGANITVFTGHSGAGKTLLLKTLANALSWFIARLKDERTAGVVMPDADIKHNATYAKVEIAVRLNGLKNLAPTIVTNVGQNNGGTSITVSRSAMPHEKEALSQVKDTYAWGLIKSLNAQGLGTSRVNLDDLMALVKVFKDNMAADAVYSLPTIAYYPLERWVLDIPLLTKGVQASDTMSGFDNGVPLTVNFARFFEWFREQEDLENERRADAHRQFFKQYGERSHASVPEDIYLLDMYARLELAQRSYISRQLDAVRKAIHMVLPAFSNLRIQRHPKLRLLIDKHGDTINFAELSQGERVLIAMVGDIARRLATHNPALPDPLQGAGIVMIDEVGLNLHPEAQQTILHRLAKAFPCLQIVATTLHAEVYRGVDNILCYALNRGQAQLLAQDFKFDTRVFMQESVDIDADEQASQAQETEAQTPPDAEQQVPPPANIKSADGKDLS